MKHIDIMNNLVFRFFLLLLPFVYFGNTLDYLFRIHLFSYTDELLYFFILSYMTVDHLRKTTINKYYLLTIIIITYFIIISLLFGYQNNIFKVFFQSFMHLKFFVYLIYISFYLDENKRIKLFLYFKYILIAAIFGFLLELFIGERLLNILNLPDEFKPSNRRSEIFYGGFINANSLSALLLAFYMLFFTKKIDANITKIVIASIFIVLFCVVLDSRTPIIILFLIFIFYFKKNIFKSKFVLPFLFVGVVLFLYLYTKTDLIERTIQNIQMSFNPKSSYIRGLMWYLSILLAIRHFPIGTGAASFGTTMSTNSKTYIELGVHKKYYFVNEIGIYDSNWSSILGEFGFIGLILIIIFIYMLTKRSIIKNNSFNVNNLMLYILFIYGLVTPIFSHGQLSMTFAFTFGLSYYIHQDKIFNKNLL